MKKMNEIHAISARNRGEKCTFVWSSKLRAYIALDEAVLAKFIPGFKSFNERARQKSAKRFLGSIDVIDCGRIPDDLPNRRCPRDKMGRKVDRLSADAGRAGVLDLLSIGQLFRSSEPGFDLLADLLGGLWCRALREVESAYQPVAVIDIQSPEIENCLTALVRAAVLRHRWHRKRASIRRKAILDFRTDSLQLPPHIQDFTGLKLRVPGKGHKPLRMPYPYQDTAALVIGASSQQLQESAPYLREAAVFLLNCAGCGDLKGHRIPTSVLDSYDPTILERLEEGRENTSLVLEAWRRLSHPGLAKAIIQAAKNSFGPPDSRYVSVTLDPRKLNRAIRYQLLLAFLTWAEDCDLLTAEEAESYRAAVKQAYDPAPVPETPVRHAEDPEIFLEVMKAIVSESDIADIGEPFRNSDKRLGAWRKISGILYLVIPENGWARTYSRRVRKDKSIDASFLQKTGWEKQLQKILAEQGLIKSTAGTYRSRYDLYDRKQGKDTYVVIVPATLLGGQESGQNALPAGNTSCPDSRRIEGGNSTE